MTDAGVAGEELLDFDAFLADGSGQTVPVRVGAVTHSIPADPSARAILVALRYRRDATADPLPAEAVDEIAREIFGPATEAIAATPGLDTRRLWTIVQLSVLRLVARTAPPAPVVPAGTPSSPFDLLASWALVEADFAREYGIDLVERLGDMSYRRFMTLVRGLGPHSATGLAHAARGYIGGPRIRESQSSAESERVFDSFFGPAQQKARAH